MCAVGQDTVGFEKELTHTAELFGPYPEFLKEREEGCFFQRSPNEICATRDQEGQMVQFKRRWPLWLMLVLVLVGQQLFFWRLHGARTFAQAALGTVIQILPFAVLFFLFRDDKRITQWRWVFFFILIIAAFLITDPFGPFGSQVRAILPRNVPLAGIIKRAVMAGGGWVLPALMLVVFLAFILVKRKSAR
ncbi:MAG TPA: hypothetical protein VK937_09410 [Candidatus Limnocylindria bacterium]|nr:hypothetical protein [Candidatus Limnocylindria bacterium]